MKKLFFIAAIAGVALASCTKNEGAPVADQNEITFAAAIGAATKATTGELTDAAYPVSDNFNVYAVWHEGDFAGWNAASLYMDDVETQYDDTFNGWRPIDRHYWPKNGKMTFAAYSPTDVLNALTHSYGKTGLYVKGFQVEAASEDHVDILYSRRSYNKQKGSENTNTPYDEVDIDFEHALASIQFTARTAQQYTGTEIRLKKISIYGVNSKGDFNENITEAAPYQTYTAAPAWTNQGEVVAKADAYVYYDYTTGQPLTDGKWVMNGVANQTDLICLPQDLPTTGTVIVTYSINPPGENTPEVNVTLETSLQTLDVKTWEPGMRYTYHLVIGLDEIYFAPEVAPWDDVDVTPDIQL